MAKHGQISPDDIAGLKEALIAEKVDINRTTAKAWAVYAVLLEKPSLDEDDVEKSALAERIIRSAAAQNRATPSLMESDAKSTPNETLIRRVPRSGKSSRIADRDGKYTQVERPEGVELE